MHVATHMQQQHTCDKNTHPMISPSVANMHAATTRMQRLHACSNNTHAAITHTATICSNTHPAITFLQLQYAAVITHAEAMKHGVYSSSQA